MGLHHARMGKVRQQARSKIRRMRIKPDLRAVRHIKTLGSMNGGIYQFEAFAQWFITVTGKTGCSIGGVVSPDMDAVAHAVFATSSWIGKWQ